MSDDLDDGEIPKEINGPAPSARDVDTVDTERTHSPYWVERTRDSGNYSKPSHRQRESQSPARQCDRSRLRARSPEFDYRQSRPRSPRRYNRPNERPLARRSPPRYRSPPRHRSPPRYRSPPRSSSSARRSSGTRKEPSVYDANTRADLGRLEREREAAAYKAKTLALTKTQSPLHPQATNDDRAGSSRPPAPSTLPNDTENEDLPSHFPRDEKKTGLGTDRLLDDTSSVKSSEIFRPQISTMEGKIEGKTDKRDHQRESLTRFNSLPAQQDGTIASTLKRQHSSGDHRRTMTQADVARIEREKEAALYKARNVSVPAKQSGVAEQQSTHDPQPRETLNTQKPVVRPVVSLTPGLDLEVAALQEEYAAILATDAQKQGALRLALRRYRRSEEDAKREAYKSDLAEQSLALAAGF